MFVQGQYASKGHVVELQFTVMERSGECAGEKHVSQKS